jgi:hypothetical protein
MLGISPDELLAKVKDFQEMFLAVAEKMNTIEQKQDEILTLLKPETNTQETIEDKADG